MLLQRVLFNFSDVFDASFGALTVNASKGNRRESQRVTTKEFVDVCVNEDAAMVGRNDEVKRQDSAAPDRRSNSTGAWDMVEMVAAATAGGDFALNAVAMRSGVDESKFRNYRIHARCGVSKMLV